MGTSSNVGASRWASSREVCDRRGRQARGSGHRSGHRSARNHRSHHGRPATTLSQPTATRRSLDSLDGNSSSRRHRGSIFPVALMPHVKFRRGRSRRQVAATHCAIAFAFLRRPWVRAGCCWVLLGTGLAGNQVLVAGVSAGARVVGGCVVGPLSC